MRVEAMVAANDASTQSGSVLGGARTTVTVARAARSGRAERDSGAKHPLPEREVGEASRILAAIEHASLARLSAGAVLRLQRSAGNRAVSQLLSGPGPRSAVLQRNPITDKLDAYAKTDSRKVVAAMAAHLLGITNALGGGDWGTAYQALYNKGVAKLANHSISLKSTYISTADYGSQEEIDQAIEAGISKGMYFSNSRTLNLPDVGVYPGTDILRAVTPATDPHLAQMVLPVALEEWIHMFQHLIGGYLSDATYSFEASAEVTRNKTSGDREWNMNEVDIYAVYRDLGWNQVLDAFRSRYEERRAFEDFMSPSLVGGAAAKKKKRCYLTTACVRARGLDDDCEELRTLRAFRDGYVLRMPAGEALIEAYYESAPQVVRRIEAREDAADIYEGIYRTLRACVDAIGNGRNALAFSIYARASMNLRAAYAPEVPLSDAIVRLVSAGCEDDDEEAAAECGRQGRRPGTRPESALAVR
jgi:hypothetical protein